MEAIKYRGLADGRIRLLELSAGVGGDGLVGDLHVVMLKDCGPDANDGTSFEALSYVWGRDMKPHSLTTAEGTVGLTESLYKFLLQLRLSDKSRLLWADAICINQDDTLEKERQVGLMSTIFSNARHVHADLGEASADTDLAIGLMDRYWRRSILAGGHEKSFGKALTPEETAFFLGIPASEIRRSAEDEELPDQNDKQWDAITRFFAKDWFSRLWIIQEFVLARDVIFHCGDHRLDWHHLLAVCTAYGRTAPAVVYSSYSFEETRTSNGMMLFACMGFLRRVFELKASPDGIVFLNGLSSGRLWNQFANCHLVDILHYFQHSKATLERDRYFALQKLSADFGHKDIPELAPDYTTDTDELILRFGRLLIGQPNGVEMFMRSGLWTSPDPHVPTWMQDFARSKRTLMDLTVSGSTHKAAGDTSFDVSFCPNSFNVVNLKGYAVDEVLVLSSTSSAADAPREWLPRVADYVQASCWTFTELLSAASHRYSSAEDAQKALYMTICAYTGYSTVSTELLSAGYWMLATFSCLPEESRDWDTVIKLLEGQDSEQFAWFASMTGEQRLEAVEGFIEEMSIPLLQELKTGTTKTGYFANLPLATVPGDEIWIIQGCRLPVVLRQSQDRPGMFRLVGSCYCHGIMNGEVLHREDFSFCDIQIH